MRKLLVFITILLIGFGFFLTRKKDTVKFYDIFPTAVPTPQAVKQPPLIITYQDKQYNVAYYHVQDISKLTLLPNFTNKKAATELKLDNQCQAFINAGFYTPENEPTGLFISGNKTLKQATSSTLLDGFIVEDGNKVYIGSVPQTDAYWAVQTGPRLFINGEKRKLSLVRDEYARRMVAVNTSRNAFYIMAFYSSPNAYDGPQLVNLPDILDIVGEELKITITDAINLDGGNASAFISPDVTLSELTSVGSFFCVK